MDITPEELKRHFQNLSDEELLDKVATGTLTPLAQGLAEAELKARKLDIPERASPEQAMPAGDQVTLEAYPLPTDAFITVGFLQDHGIAASVADANTLQMNPLWAGALGGTRVMVPESQLDEARRLVKQRNAGKFQLSDDETGADAEGKVIRVAGESGGSGALTIKVGWFIISVSIGFAIALFLMSALEDPKAYGHDAHITWVLSLAVSIAIYALWLRAFQKKLEARRHSEDQELAPLNAKDYFEEARQAGAVFVAMHGARLKTVGSGGKEIWPSWSSEDRAQDAIAASVVFSGCKAVKVPLAKFLEEVEDAPIGTSVGLNWQGKKATGMDQDKVSFLNDMAKHA